MAFLVEDGTGLPLANAYVSTAAFKAYHKDRSNSLGTAGSSEIKDAIIKATDYMDRRFKNRFIGRRKDQDRSSTATTGAQRLEWPRENARLPAGVLLDAESVPIEVEEACFEYAFRALTITLAPDPTVDDRNQAVVLSKVKVGPIEEETEYATGGQQFQFRTYPEVDAILRGLVIPSGRSFR